MDITAPPQRVCVALKLLHWGTVLLVSTAYLSAYYRKHLTTQTESSNWYVLVLHINVGLLIVLCSLLMLALRRRKLPPQLSPPRALSRWLARLSKVALYTCLLAIPLCAYIGLGFKLPLAGIYWLDSFAQLSWAQAWVAQTEGMLMISFQEPFADFHQRWGSDYLLPALVTLHVCAALYHHFILRDQTLKAMLPGG